MVLKSEFFLYDFMILKLFFFIDCCIMFISVVVVCIFVIIRDSFNNIKIIFVIEK